jgi:hypothetical protein
MKKLTILFTILLIFIVSVNAKSIFLSGYMEEGETKVYETDEGIYVLNLLTVSDSSGKSVFRLNDEMSRGIKDGDSYVFKDGSEIVVRDVIINEAEDGKDESYYYFYGTGEGVLNLRNVSRYVVENNLCNFDTHCSNETKENCCYDCGCGDEGECVNNECVYAEDEVDNEEKEDVEKEEKVVKIDKKDESTEGDKEKKAAYSMLAIILALMLVVIWFVLRKVKRRPF